MRVEYRAVLILGEPVKVAPEIRHNSAPKLCAKIID